MILKTAIKAANLAAPVLSAVENVSGRVLEAAKEHSYRDGVITGDPTPCSPWYSSGMLSYLYAAERLGLA